MKKIMMLLAFLMALSTLGMAQGMKKVEYSQLPKDARRFLPGSDAYLRFGFMRNGYWEYGECQQVLEGDRLVGMLATYRVYRGNQMDRIREKVMKNKQNFEYHDQMKVGEVEQKLLIADGYAYVWAFYNGYTILQKRRWNSASLTRYAFEVADELMDNQGSAFVVVGYPEGEHFVYDNACLSFKREVERYMAQPETW